MKLHDITVKAGLRPCIVKGQRALFHCWEDKSEVVAPSVMVGGHKGGTVRGMLGIIEREDGSIHECYPSEIVFIDAALQNEETDNVFKFYEDMQRKLEAENKVEKKKAAQQRGKEYAIPCPHCGSSAYVYADTKNKEYFTYCDKCEVETKCYKTKKAAVQAFNDGMVTKV